MERSRTCTLRQPWPHLGVDTTVWFLTGPGQGEMLYEQRIPLRPDWEKVIAAVVDYAVEQPIVDPERIALSGWSLGGHLAPVQRPQSRELQP